MKWNCKFTLCSPIPIPFQGSFLRPIVIIRLSIFCVMILIICLSVDVSQNLLGRVSVVSHKELDALRVDVIGARHIVCLLDVGQLVGEALSVQVFL